ncbi:LOW QUALITY PROTEIN: hypothetical protein OSB04_021485 [Centaurea solstitialis]|uniref:Reverse transcriptase n=1 Tax=Centaurea solstitialis TaxID=347529 RepID=A0AA38W6T2_9ASTR|nr:LOW QUALITY PROTEIN: hypothetical protein OSB04_021485 [Centaurea solstitialis]
MAHNVRGFRQPPRRDADRGNDDGWRDPRDIAEIARLQQRVRELELQREERREETETDTDVWGDGDGNQNPFGRRNPRRGQYVADLLRSMGVKVDVPEFDGKAQPDDFIDWLSTVERVKLVAIKLRKYASLWWDHVKKQRAQEGRSKVETWSKMKKLLCEKFLPVNHRQESFMEYHSLSQRTSTVEEFITEFDRLRMRCGFEEPEEQIIARFLGALRPEISDVVQLQPYWTYNDVCSLALKVEKQVKAKAKSVRYKSNINRNNTFRSPTEFSPNSGSKLNPIKAEASCGSNTSSIAPIKLNRCFKCQGIGHFARDCLNQQLVTLTEYTPPTYDTDNAEGEETECEIVYPDQGEALVSQQVLSVTPTTNSDDTLWLRYNIFRTKCTTKGKVCSLIIDGGSCENMVASSTVEKLALSVEPHSEPYQLTWLKKGNIVKVNQRCLVQFSIGNRYSDEVWCEVIPMDACHVLLGRPWQYDRRTTHDRFRNTYSFRKDGTNITLAPLDSRETEYAWMNPRSKQSRHGPHRHQFMSSIVAPITDCIKGSQFAWSPAASNTFEELKKKPPVLALPNFQVAFQVECDASGVGIGGVLSQDSRPIAFLLNEARQKYSTYDKEFYAIIRSLEYWRHYLLPGEFVLYSDHRALRFINGQHKLNPRHAKWVEYLQDFSFVIRHKAGTSNTVADALNRRQALLTSLQVQVEGFEVFRGLYPDDPDFSEVWKLCHTPSKVSGKNYSIHDGFLFKNHQLCVPKCSLRDAIILESHQGGLAGHFGRDKTVKLVCHVAKAQHSNTGLYTPLRVPEGPWEDVSLDFVVGLPRTQRQNNSIMVVVDRFSKTAYFVPCAKTYDASLVARLYFAEIVKLHGVPKSLTSDCDVKFVGHFWRTLWKWLGSRLHFSSAHHPQSDGQTEVTNRSLGNLLRSLVGNNPRQWDVILPQAEFAYNRSPYRSTGRSPFFVVYGRNPFTPLDLAPLAATEHFCAEGEERAENQVNTSASVPMCIVRGWFLKRIHLRKDRFPKGRAGKLQPRADGPFKVLEHINDNAYKIELPSHYNVSATFNVADLKPFVAEEDDSFDSRTSPFEEGENDGDDPD